MEQTEEFREVQGCVYYKRLYKSNLDGKKNCNQSDGQGMKFEGKFKVVNRNLIVENIVNTLTTSRRIVNHLNQVKLLINDLLVLL